MNNNFSEVPHDAPRNQKGDKPFYIEIWHPDEGIDISTIQSAVNDFAKTFLKLDNVDIQINEVEFDVSLNSYMKQGHDDQFEVVFTDDLVKKLSVLWNKSTEDTLNRLNRSLQ
jgi:hypothetical protein